MKKRLVILALSMISLFSAAAAVVSTIAWFSTENKMDYVEGGAVASYFKSGSGTQNDPFIIASRNHVYNLAWLQYIGYFNDSTNFSGIQQLYFEVENDIDMEGLTIPPIGTEKYPFLGHFDGNGCTISNFTISNDDPEQDDSDFGVAKPINLYDGEVSDVVGFFGVVGKLSTQAITYDTSVVSISNVKLKDFTVKSKTNQTLIGLAAGYVNGDLANVKVGKSTISVDGCKPITSITNNLSDYSLVGYSSSTSTFSDFTKKISENFNKTVSGGTIGGFDSSIDFYDLDSWFWKLHKNKDFDSGDLITDGKSDDVGFFIHQDYSSTYSRRYNSKTGTGYSAVYNTVYYSCPTAYALLYNVASNPYSAITYEFNQDSDGDLYGVYGRTKKSDSEYCGTLKVAFTATHGSDASNEWFDVIFERSFTYATGKTLDRLTLVRSTNSTYYKAFRAFEYGTRTYVNDKNKYFGNTFTWYFTASVARLQTGTCIPLAFADENENSVNNHNTGYIVGKSASANMYGNGSPKIGSYDKNTYLNGSLTNGVINNGGISYFNGSSWAAITDTKDGDGNVTSSSPSFNRYIGPRNALKESIDESPRIHGIHFDYNNGAGDVSTSNYIDKQLITSYSKELTDYRMPTGSIDFYLKEAGYITFFAGTYSDTASVPINFFSLYKVERPTSNGVTSFNSITSIKEISKIYKTETFDENNPTYLYEYYGESTPSPHGDLVYDLSCLWTEKTNSDHKLYYFEIPIGVGEFAMGAVNSAHNPSSNVQGAYMMYLDLGSNGHSSGESVLNAQYIETTSSSEEYPAGIDFSISGLSSVGGNTVCIRIVYTDLINMSATVAGEISFNPTTVVVVDSEIPNCGCCYDAGDILDDSSSTESIGDLSGSGGGGKRQIIADILTSSDVRWKIEYTELMDANGNVTSASYTKIIEDDVNKTAQGVSIVPSLFTDNIVDIKAAIMAVQLEYEATDFNITEITYDGTIINLTIPVEELGDTELDVVFGTNYNSLKINGSTYPNP